LVAAVNSAELLDRHVVARAGRQLAATSFTCPGSAPTWAVTLIERVYTRAQIRAERRHRRKTDTAAA
jgi:hypothetical protein